MDRVFRFPTRAVRQTARSGALINCCDQCCVDCLRSIKTGFEFYSTQTGQLQGNLAAKREFSAAVRQSGPANQKRTTPSRPAKTVQMAAVHLLDVYFAAAALAY